jgi:hypothetical protein
LRSRALPGALGPRGDKGDKGEPAPRLALWSVDEEGFVATPIFGDGSSGAPLNLLGLFESYDRATSGRDDADLVSDAADAREAAKREAEASRWAK